MAEQLIRRYRQSFNRLIRLRRSIGRRQRQSKHSIAEILYRNLSLERRVRQNQGCAHQSQRPTLRRMPDIRLIGIRRPNRTVERNAVNKDRAFPARIAYGFHIIGILQIAGRKEIRIETLATVEQVASRARRQRIVSLAAVEPVVALPAVQVIVSRYRSVAVVVAPQNVIARTAVQHIVAVLADKQIITRAAMQHIRRTARSNAVYIVRRRNFRRQRVIAGLGVNHNIPSIRIVVRTACAVQIVRIPFTVAPSIFVAQRTGRNPYRTRHDQARHQRHNGRNRTVIEINVPATRGNIMSAAAGAQKAVAQNHIVARAAEDRIAAFAARNQIAVCAAENLIITLARSNPVAAFGRTRFRQMAICQLRINHIVAHAAVNQIPACAADDDVAVFRLLRLGFVARKIAPVQQIVALAAVDDVRAVASVHTVVARTCRHRQPARAARKQHIVLIAARQIEPTVLRIRIEHIVLVRRTDPVGTHQRAFPGLRIEHGRLLFGHQCDPQSRNIRFLAFKETANDRHILTVFHQQRMGKSRTHRRHQTVRFAVHTHAQPSIVAFAVSDKTGRADVV